MGFKDKVRNNQNAEHATIEDYHKSLQSKYEASQALNGTPAGITENPTLEVIIPFIVEPVSPLVETEEVEVPSFVKTVEIEEAQKEAQKEEPYKEVPEISKPVSALEVKAKKIEPKKASNKKKNKTNI